MTLVKSVVTKNAAHWRQSQVSTGIRFASKAQPAVPMEFGHAVSATEKLSHVVLRVTSFQKKQWAVNVEKTTDSGTFYGDSHRTVEV